VGNLPTMMSFTTARALALPFIALTCVTGCGKPPEQGAPPPAQVSVIEVRPQSVPLTREVVGRLAATRMADVRARVPGVLLRRLYTEGSDVKADQPLFQIDPTELKAELNSALAALASAEAAATNAHVAAERARKLIADKLLSQADVDNAEANERSTAAQVKQAQAQAQTARIRLGYALVRAPIAGRAGQQRVTEGALVGQTEPTLLTTIEQIDPIYIAFDQPAAVVEQLRRSENSGNVTLLGQSNSQVQLLSANGQPFGDVGTVDFSGASVDPTTGAVAFRGTIANPSRTLLPGMFVKARVTLGQRNQVFKVPQNAVLRDNTGPYVWTVGSDGKAVQQRIATETMEGSDWLVSTGLSDGDRVVVTGAAGVRPGSPVTVVPAPSLADQESAPRQGGGSAAGAGRSSAK
jgi:membrane fusion protein (multidrug efflux system)